MPTHKQQRRRALELLEASIDGCTEAIMLAYGFKTELLVELVNAGLATASIERMVAAGAGSKSPACGLPGLAGRRSRSFDGPDPQTGRSLAHVRFEGQSGLGRSGGRLQACGDHVLIHR